MFDLVFGLPVHPLAVHAPVVLVPLSCVGVLVYAFVPRWRWALRWPLLVVVTLGAISTPAAYFSGETFQERLGLEGSRAVQRHAEFGQWALIAVFIWWLVVTFLLVRTGSTRSREPRPPTPLLVAAVILSLVSIGAIVVTGHSGASSVWSPRVGST